MRIEVADGPLAGLALARAAVGGHKAQVHQLVAIVGPAAVHLVAELRVQALELHPAAGAVSLAQRPVPAHQGGFLVPAHRHPGGKVPVEGRAEPVEVAELELILNLSAYLLSCELIILL